MSTISKYAEADGSFLIGEFRLSLVNEENVVSLLDDLGCKIKYADYSGQFYHLHIDGGVFIDIVCKDFYSLTVSVT